jgi:hypothetical protein
MGISLNGLTPANTYQSLIKVGDNSQLTATLKTLSDGFGTDLPMEVSTSGVNFTGTLTQNGLPITTTPSGVAGAIQFSDGSAFASDAANLFWDDTNNRLGVGTNVPIATTTINASGSWVSGFSNNLRLNGSNPSLQLKTDTGNGGFMIATSGNVTYFLTSANSSFTGKNDIGNIAAAGNWNFGTASNLSATVGIKGSGSTSATTSLLVQNSSGTELFKVRDDGDVNIPDTAIIGALTLVSNKIIGTSIRLQPTSGYLSISKDASAAPANTMVYIKGSGSTSATTALLVQNSSGTNNAVFRDNGEVSLLLQRTGKGLQLIDNLAPTQSSSYYHRGGVAEVSTSTAALNYFWWANNNGTYPNGVFAYNNGVFIVSSTQKNLNTASSTSAVLQADSTNRGFLPPRMTTTQKNAISSPASGLMVYDTDTNKLCCYNGTSWNDLF